jgi:hypothetical protein
MRRCSGKARKVKKAQLVFEFLIAVLIFFGLLFYTINYLSWTVSGYSADFSGQNMESEVSQVAELLVLNKGSWPGGNPAIVGLAQEWPVLNSTKISWLNSSCNSDYENFVKRFDVSPKHRLKVTVTETLPSGAASVRADCRWGVDIPSTAASVETRRYALSESGNILAIRVGIWTTGK